MAALLLCIGLKKNRGPQGAVVTPAGTERVPGKAARGDIQTGSGAGLGRPGGSQQNSLGRNDCRGAEIDGTPRVSPAAPL